MNKYIFKNPREKSSLNKIIKLNIENKANNIPIHDPR